jgi:hypothetical protein
MSCGQLEFPFAYAPARPGLDRVYLKSHELLVLRGSATVLWRISNRLERHGVFVIPEDCHLYASWHRALDIEAEVTPDLLSKERRLRLICFSGSATIKREIEAHREIFLILQMQRPPCCMMDLFASVWAADKEKRFDYSGFDPGELYAYWRTRGKERPWEERRLGFPA